MLRIALLIFVTLKCSVIYSGQNSEVSFGLFKIWMVNFAYFRSNGFIPSYLKREILDVAYSCEGPRFL